LAPEIHAIETGLSSDPPMNWRVKNLDGINDHLALGRPLAAKLGAKPHVNGEISFDDIMAPSNQR